MVSLRLFPLLLLGLVAQCWGSGLIDHPIAGDAIVYLDGSDWTATAAPSLPITIPAVVPGDLVSDIARAYGYEPLYEKNWKNGSLWDEHDWSYTKAFTSPSTPADGGARTLSSIFF